MEKPEWGKAELISHLNSEYDGKLYSIECVSEYFFTIFFNIMLIHEKRYSMKREENNKKIIQQRKRELLTILKTCSDDRIKKEISFYNKKVIFNINPELSKKEWKMFKWELKKEGFIKKDEGEIKFKVTFELIFTKVGEVKLIISVSRLEFNKKEKIGDILQGLYISLWKEFNRIYLNPYWNCNQN